MVFYDKSNNITTMLFELDVLNVLLYR